MRSRPIALYMQPLVTIRHEVIQFFLRDARQQPIAQLDPVLELLVARPKDDVTRQWVATDQHLVAFEAIFSRQPHGLAATVLEEFGGVHGGDSGSVVYTAVYAAQCTSFKPPART